jgi:hypothetical protein
MEKQRCDASEADPLRSFARPTLPPSFALLIDADNTSVELFPTIMKQVETWGSVTLRRAYGNQETLLGQKWKDLCLLYALQPMVHIGISGVKNATDIALTVDAMDLLHTQAIRCFCLVTGDQDFTALVLRLRSYGCQVYCIETIQSRCSRKGLHRLFSSGRPRFATSKEVTTRFNAHPSFNSGNGRANKRKAA